MLFRSMIVGSFVQTLSITATIRLQCMKVTAAKNVDQSDANETMRQTCAEKLARIPKIVNSAGQVIVPSEDLPILMVQTYQHLLERYPSSAYVAPLAPVISQALDLIRLLGMSEQERNSELSPTRSTAIKAKLLEMNRFIEAPLLQVNILSTRNDRNLCVLEDKATGGLLVRTCQPAAADEKRYNQLEEELEVLVRRQNRLSDGADLDHDARVTKHEWDLFVGRKPGKAENPTPDQLKARELQKQIEEIGRAHV